MNTAPLCLALMLTACDATAWGVARTDTRPDSFPRLISQNVSFHYPSALYLQRVEGDVTLRLHIDTSGAVVRESIRVVDPSGRVQLDAAAQAGAPALRFRPAMKGGRPLAFTVLFPVKFRVSR
ncbi:MAG: energy transducer TonB [Gemmatimonadaceae bacterium]